MIKEQLSKIPKAVRWPLGIGIGVLFAIVLWFYGAKAWNGIGNYFFHRKADALSADVKKQLADAAEQKKLLERTLIELQLSKEELARATKAREDAERIFNDKSKTASEKLKEYQQVMSANPIRTDPTGVTTSDLCARAKAIGSDQSVIDALCN